MVVDVGDLINDLCEYLKLECAVDDYDELEAKLPEITKVVNSTILKIQRRVIDEDVNRLKEEIANL